MTDTPRIREAMAELQAALALLPELPCPAAPGECFCTGACQHPAGRHIRNAIRYLNGQTRR